MTQAMRFSHCLADHAQLLPTQINRDRTRRRKVEREFSPQTSRSHYGYEGNAAGFLALHPMSEHQLCYYKRYYNSEKLDAVSWTTWTGGPAQKHGAD